MAATNRPHDDMIGQVIDGAFQVRSALGEGGYGVVYECLDLELGRSVALKLLVKERAGEKELERFRKEGKHLASLNHPNVVHIYRLGEYQGAPYFAMEFVAGRSLKDLQRHERLSIRSGLEIMRQVAAGLQAIHDAGIVHHDLSTNNVLVTPAGAVKIVDFGLSRDANIAHSFSQSHLAGTLPYVAPEQIEGRGSNAVAEVFSLGVILYEVMAGKHPFWAEHTTALLYNIAHKQPEPLETHLESCPPSLSRLVGRCLQKKPHDRVQSAAEVEHTLAEILAGQALDSTVPPRALVAPRARATSRNPYLSRTMIKNRDQFFGRHQEVRRIFARLNASPPGSMSIVGDRKIGKSSLLNYVYTRQTRESHLDDPDHMVMVFLDFQEEKDMSIETFVKTLLGIAAIELRGRVAVEDCAHSLDGIKDFVQRLSAAGYRLAILLDEFDAITTNRNFGLEFFSFLRFLANHYDVAYLTSSARDLQVLCHTKEISDSPFFNIFSNLRLSVFQPQEAAELIRVPSEMAGRPLEPYQADILEMAGLFPFFLQMACSHTLEWMEEHPQTRPPDFAAIRQHFYEEAKLHYRYIWDAFDQHERSAAVRVAQHKSIPDALRHVLAELETKHYVEAAGAGSRLFATTFEDFVNTEAGRGGDKPSILGRLFWRR
jgi:serine/threonine protein kinase